MSDTVSAAQLWSSSEVRMNFLAPSAQSDMGSLHISGGANFTYASPSLIVHFAVASPDLPAPSLGPSPDPASPTVSAYAAGASDDLQPVVIVGGLHAT